MTAWFLIWLPSRHINGSKWSHQICPTSRGPSECRGGQATHGVIIHGLQKLWRGKFLQSRSDERDSMFGVSLVVNPAHKPRAFGEAWRRLAKLVSDSDSV